MQVTAASLYVLPHLVTLTVLSFATPARAAALSNGRQHRQAFVEVANYLQAAEYLNANSPYYVYKFMQVYPGLSAQTAATVQPFAQLPSYGYYYYGTPVYDLRFPINPIFPATLLPGLPATPPSLPTPGPFDVEGDDDGIEKLDTKFDTDNETKKPLGNGENLDDDSITVEAI